jgi:hypothetical protein
MIGGPIGKAIGEDLRDVKTLALDNAAVTVTGQALTLTAAVSTRAHTPLLTGEGVTRAYWKGRTT